DTLFLKTHSHSVNFRYRLGEEETPIPHVHPDVVKLFDLLLRVCDKSRIEFMPVTVNEAMEVLQAIDQASQQDPEVVRRAIDKVAMRVPSSTAGKAEGLGAAFDASGGVAHPTAIQSKEGGESGPARDLSPFFYSGSSGLSMRPYGADYKSHCPVCS